MTVRKGLMLSQHSQIKFPCSGLQNMMILRDRAIKEVNMLIPWVLIQCDSVIISGEEDARERSEGH